MSGFVSLTDESLEEEEIKAGIKEEHEVGVAHSWKKAGGFPVLAEEETQGLLWQVFLFTWYGLAFLTILSLFYG